MRVFIIEDELPAQRLLLKTLEASFPDVEVIGCATSVAQSVAYLEDPTNPVPDVIFMDVELSDGKCFEIFRRTNVSSKVVMTTAYDTYAVKAFEVNSVDYLLKPIETSALRRAVSRCKNGETSTIQAPDMEKILASLASHTEAQTVYKERFLVHLNDRIVPVKTKDIVLFFSYAKDSHVLTCGGTVYVMDTTLDSLVSDLNPEVFFRINRSTILEKNSVESVVKVLGGRLQVSLSPGLSGTGAERALKDYKPDLVVSRSRADEFLLWLEK